MGRPSAREEIVQAGLKCLVEKGFNAVGVQDITDTAGVPKGSFYNHFESKKWCKRGIWGTTLPEIKDQKPRAGMLDVGARPGSLLFHGEIDNAQYSGTAYIFSPHCGPI